MDWSSWISALAAVLSLFGGAFSYYQSRFSRRAREKANMERERAEKAEAHAVEVNGQIQKRLEIMEEQTKIFEKQFQELQEITKTLTPSRPYIVRLDKNQYAIFNKTPLPLKITRIVNKDKFVILNLDDNFEIQAFAQYIFSAVGSWQLPLPSNLILQAAETDEPLYLPIPR